MSHFAKINPQGIVTNVIVADQEFIDTYLDNAPGYWLQTSYNTHGGVHNNDGTPFRKNFAAIGYTYDKNRDAFIPPKPADHPSWVLDEETCLWKWPTPMPSNPPAGKHYVWNETNVAWELADNL
jgi:hypothetical protein